MLNEQVIKINKLDVNTIDYINKHYASNPNIVLEINNTKGVSSGILQLLDSRCRIKIVGGYTDELLKDKWYKDSFNDAITYTRNETVQIVRKMEEIEKGILPNWSQLQKTLYLYNKLKAYIVYDKNHVRKDQINLGDRENRSLRALISRKTVCAGYSVTLKEMLDRQGIDNELVIGGTKDHPGNHAWLIVKINGRKFPLDLTWDAGRYRAGNFGASKNNFINVEQFIEDHIPDMGNATMNYERELSGLTPEFIDRISLPLSRDEQYTTTTYKVSRDDGSSSIISQMSEKVINGVKYYQFAFSNKGPYERNYSKPVIVYSETNLASFIKRKVDTNNPLTADERDFENSVITQLFSKENVEQSIRGNSSYIGNIRRNPYTGRYELSKNYSLLAQIPAKQRQFRRRDGSEFVLRESTAYYIAGRFVNSYDCCEVFVDSDGKQNIRKNVIFSEQDLLSDNRPEFASDFLSRDRIHRLAKQNGGYVGVFGNRGTIIYDPNIKAKMKLNRMNWAKEDIVKCTKLPKLPQTFVRSDGTAFTLARMHRSPRSIYKNHLVQYEYVEKVPKKGGGFITRKKKIYAQDNLFDILRQPDVIDSDFSREKMSDENLLKTGRYIGRWEPNTRTFQYDMKVAKFFIKNKGIDFTSADFTDKINKVYKRDTRRVKRSDGTSLRLRKIEPEKEVKIYGKRVYQYEYVEDVKVAPWIRERRKGTLFSEEDLLTERRQDVIDYLLSQKRIQKQMRDAGGYLGYYDEKGNRNVVGKRVAFFSSGIRDFSRYPDSYTVNDEPPKVEKVDREER